MHFNVIDYRSALKHAYYGCESKMLSCEKTGRKYAEWHAAAPDLLTRYLLPILESEGSLRHTIVVHDMGNQFRKDIYPQYKGQASKKDENKSPIEIEQVKLLDTWAKLVFRHLGITQIGVNGVEADDVMAWIAQGVEEAKGTVTIYTTDQDMLQLVSDAVAVHTMTSNDKVHFGADGVYPEGHALQGLPYRLTSFAKSITGDTSDNYPGVKGAGPTAVLKMLATFDVDGLDELATIVSRGDTKPLDEAIAANPDVKILTKLREQFGEWRTGWKLAILRPELCWKPRVKKIPKPVVDKRVPNAQRAFEQFVEVGADDLWNDHFLDLMPSPFAITPENWGEMREDILASLAESDIVAFDYESSDKTRLPGLRKASARGQGFVDNYSQELAGASFQFGKHLENVIYIPVDHADVQNNLPMDVIAEILAHCQKKGVTLVAHNAYFEGIVTYRNLGMWLKNVRDTRIMQRVFDENSEAGLKFLSSEMLKYKQTGYQETIDGAKWWEETHGEKATAMCHLTLDEVFSYGADDSLVTGHLHDLLQFMLVLDRQWNFYQAYRVRPTEVLQRSYVDGVAMNWALQKRVHRRDLEMISEHMKALRELLEANVDGNVTAGAESLISAEREYVYKAALRKTDNKDSAQATVQEWAKKIRAACQYTPFREEKVMPKFAFTEKQISAGLEGVGLPAIERLSQRGWEDYMEQIGAVGFSSEWKFTDEQMVVIKTLINAYNADVPKLGELRKRTLESEEDNPEQTAALIAAEEQFERTAGIIQCAAKIKPRSVSFGDELNVGSPQQMQQLLYCKIGAPVRLRAKTKPGKGRLALGITESGPATDEQAVLTALANDYQGECWQREALGHLRLVKSASTRCSLYHDKYPLWRHVDGRIHPYITDCGTDTRRPSGGAPNVLQVSKKDEEMRSMFIPPHRDYVCVAIDFNGQEIRLMANNANDPVMMSVYEPGNEKDLHSMTGAGIANISYEVFQAAIRDENNEYHKQASKHRKKAKTVNFGMAYGSGAGTLSRNLIVPKEEAQTLLDKTMKLYSRIRPWQEETAKFMNDNGFTLTAFGSKRHATERELYSTDNGKSGRQHRQGTNFTIQGTAADMLAIVLTDIAESGILDRLRMSFFAPIYDEIVSWVHKDDVLEYCQIVGGFMEASTPPGHKVRQVPEYSIGPDWGRVHELKRDISPENVAKYVAMSLEEATDIWEKDVLEPFDPINKETYVEFDEGEIEEALENEMVE